MKWGMAVLCSSVLCGALAQELPDASAAQRAHIEATRERESAVLDAQERDCASRFAVTDCVNAVRARRRQILAGLQRQEVALDDAQRQQRAQEQRQATRDKLEEQRARASDAAATPAEPRKSANAGASFKPAVSAVARAPRGEKTPLAGMPSVQERTSNLAAFERKQKQAAQRKLERDQQLREHPSTQPPLPVPP